MPQNRFKVNAKAWRKWSPVARQVFNETFEIMRDNVGAFLSRGATAPGPRSWRVTAWNAAWMAAHHATQAAKR